MFVIQEKPLFLRFLKDFLMKISLNWIKEILDFDLSAEETSEILTDIGLEVEKSEQYENIKGGLNGIVVGEIKKCDKHPNADKLKITHVDIGQEKLSQIICGAPNVDVNQKVLVALPGTTIFPINHDPLKIKKAKIRGVESNGMICAEDEIGIGENHDGIMVLSGDYKAGDQAKIVFDVKEDTIFDIGLTPNRADAMSHYGVARDLMAALKYNSKIEVDQKLKPLSSTVDFNQDQKTTFKVSVLEPKKCMRYTGIILKNVQVKSSPNWLKNKLTSIGVKSINNIVDATNYILHELGQPLHAFDLDEISNHHIKVRCPKADTAFTTLDGTERKLDKDDLMICDDEKEMCIAGVFGGLKSGVSNKTKHIFLESALFDPVHIRKTAKRHGLNTDASFRYERGVDPDMVIPALQKAVELIIELAGGSVGSSILDINNNPKSQNHHHCDADYNAIRKLCGISITDEEINSILALLEISNTPVKNSSYRLKIPDYRVDVNREADVAEEVLRIYGYNNVIIPSKIKSSPSFTPLRNSISTQKKVSDYLSARGFNELLNNSLTATHQSNKLKYTGLKEEAYVKLLNPLSSDTEVLRQTLALNVLDVIKYNQDHGEVNVQLFEWGKTYQLNQNKFQEENQLIIALKGLQHEEHWYDGKKETSFHQLKGYVESIFSLLGITLEASIFENNELFSGGVIYQIGNKMIAKCGLVNPHLTNQLDIKEPCYIAELYWDNMYQICQKNPVKYIPINKFQKVYRDLSILIDEQITLSDIVNATKNVKTNLLQNISLFDIYRDKKQFVDKKAYGLRFQFLHPKRTLTDKEVDKVMQQIQHSILKETNGQLR